MVKRTKRYTFSPVSDVDVEESMFLSPVFNFSFFKTKARFPQDNKWRYRTMIFLALVQAFLSSDITKYR